MILYKQQKSIASRCYPVKILPSKRGLLIQKDCPAFGANGFCLFYIFWGIHKYIYKISTYNAKQPIRFM